MKAHVLGSLVIAGVATTGVRADANSDWIARSTAPGVVMAVGFDTQAQVTNDTFPDTSAYHVKWEQLLKTSGAGSLRMDIFKTDGASSGSWVRYLADDRREFKTGDTFYVQFRQYFPAYFANHAFAGTQFGGPYAGGWKQAIISNKRASNQLFEVVIQNTNHRSMVQGYNRDSQASYPPWEEPISTPCSNSDFVFQNKIDRGGPETTCLDSRRKRGGLFSYGGSNKGGPDPETGAFIYYPDEWLTFLVRVSPGSFGAGIAQRDTRVAVWAARANATDYTLLIDKMVNLGAETDSSGKPFYFDAIWLLPFNTLKVPEPSGQDTFTLYDELIVSTNFIAAPGGAGVAPNPPSNVSAQ